MQSPPLLVSRRQRLHLTRALGHGLMVSLLGISLAGDLDEDGLAVLSAKVSPSHDGRTSGASLT